MLTTEIHWHTHDAAWYCTPERWCFHLYSVVSRTDFSTELDKEERGSSIRPDRSGPSGVKSRKGKTILDDDRDVVGNTRIVQYTERAFQKS